MQPRFQTTVAWAMPAFISYIVSMVHLSMVNAYESLGWALFAWFVLPKILYAPAIVWYLRTLANVVPLSQPKVTLLPEANEASWEGYRRIASPTWAFLVLFIPVACWLMPYYWLHDAYQRSSSEDFPVSNDLQMVGKCTICTFVLLPVGILLSQIAPMAANLVVLTQAALMVATYTFLGRFMWAISRNQRDKAQAMGLIRAARR